MKRSVNMKIYIVISTLFLSTYCLAMEKDDNNSTKNSSGAGSSTTQKSNILHQKIAKPPRHAYKQHFASCIHKYILTHNNLPLAASLTLAFLWLRYIRHFSCTGHREIQQWGNMLALGIFLVGTSYTGYMYLHKKERSPWLQEYHRTEEYDSEAGRRYFTQVKDYFGIDQTELDKKKWGIPKVDNDAKKNERNTQQILSSKEKAYILVNFKGMFVFDTEQEEIYSPSQNPYRFSTADDESIENGIANCTELICDKDHLPSFVQNMKILDTILLLRNLQKLTIKGADRIYADMLKLPNLTYLKITHSPRPINCVTDELYQQKNLTEIILPYNGMSDEDMEPLTFDELLHLQRLDISHNQLTTFPQYIFTCSALTELDISHNQLSVFPETVRVQENEKRKDSEHIDSPDTFVRLVNLTRLNLSHNQLESLPDTITALSNLTELDLSHNELTSLPDDINRMSSLQVLDLTNNPIVNSTIIRWWSLPKGLNNQPGPRMTFNRTPRAIEEG